MKFKTKKSHKTYERVLAAAIRLFQKKGYSNTTMRNLSEESQLGLGAIYYYFRSKEDLVQVFYHRINEQVIQEYRSRFQKQNNFPKAVEQLMRLKIEILTPYKSLMQVIIKEAVDYSSPLSPFAKKSEDVKELSVGFFVELAEEGKVKEAAEVAQQTWLFHLMLLALWTQDSTENCVVTQNMITHMKDFLKISLLASKIPGLGSLQKNVRNDMAKLFR